MNKKSTLLAAALMAVSSFTANAADTPVPSTEWTAGNYYYLKADGKYLSLCGTKADSVVVKSFDAFTKASRDSALWEITKAGTETAGVVYQFKNKKTQALLSFDASLSAKPILAEGVSKWIFKDNIISAYISGDKEMKLSYSEPAGIVFNSSTGTSFVATKPGSNIDLTPTDLGGGFSVFRLSFGGKFEGNLFEGKDLIASTDEEGYIKLQVAGDESYDNGEKKYLGVDTLKTIISGATGAYGYKFSLDSIRKEVGKENKSYKQFKFTVDLKNDSLTMYVRNAPNVKSTITSDKKVRVVYAQLDNNSILTVADVETPTQGVLPFISVEKGTPTEIVGGTGVYFLKSASKTVDGGKYISSFEGSEIKTMTGKPSVNQLEGQWYIKEDNGMYSIVDRKSNTSMLLKGEVFAVQGMANTFTFGGNADSITVEPQKVNLDDKFLGSANFTTAEMANNGYALNLIPAGAETSSSYTVTADSILQVKSVDGKDAVIFKIVAVDTLKIGGAQALKDTVSIVKYQLKSQFSDKYVAYDTEKKSLKVSSSADALDFFFNINVDGGKYSMEIAAGGNKGKYITADLASSNMVLSETPAYFNFVEMEAPEYGTFDSGNKRFTSDLKSLTMNPFSRFAEAKQEGQEILKMNYEKDNFSLWLSKSKASTAEKPLYFIMTSMEIDGDPNASRHYFYMVSGRDSLLFNDAAKEKPEVPRVHFIKNDTIETMKDNANNPALFALKVTESGNYLLENQKELNRTGGAPYVGIINNVVVMTKDGVEFSVETAPAPVANENIEAPTAIKVIGGVGEFSIRNAHGKKITVSNILGQTIATRVVSSDYVTVPTTRGVVIVSVEGDKAYKVIVK
ncbi:DUF6383 domain-containing protein [Parabacteroides gordonii]|uniref:DUF6383 domain-containing protein n=1 Tax=Parabacteroides gordonii TaxID=574930 RepID=UPI0026F30479|nr:DUF6383 domain-containing protein [Parabacteroides gordonii]